MNKQWHKKVILQLGWSKFSLKPLDKSNFFEIDGFYIPPNYGTQRLEVKLDGLLIKSESQTFHANEKFGDYQIDVWHYKAVGELIAKNNLISISTEFAGNRSNSLFHDWFWISNNRPTPPLDLMLYIGASDPNWFHFAGGTWAEKSLRTFEYFTNRRRSDIKRIIDWGCGCARVSRHYFDLCNAQIIGLDIDEKVINWCKTELPAGQWITATPLPPMNLPDNTADLIIGHSVFTHLDEFTQFQWLKELARLVRPDGLVMVTVLGVFATLLEPPLTVEEEETLQENGFLEPTGEKIQTNKQIVLSESDKEHRTYHKGVFHMPDYIATQWTNFFEVIAIIEGFADHQALVVLKKK